MSANSLIPEPDASPQERLHYRDVKPFAMPRSLDELHGPATGVIILPIWADWAPGERAYDVATPQRRHAYEQIIGEGTRQLQDDLLNPWLLEDSWPILGMDMKIRDAWEERFPGLGRRRIDWETHWRKQNTSE